MGIFRKLAVKGKNLMARALAAFDRIESPLVRLLVGAMLAGLAFWLAWKAAPLLILFGVLIVATYCLLTTSRAKDGE